ncbi:MAG TPA: acyl-CoA dehydrogenase family protein [Acidimicrobiales bacterium]|nr:acyl-CoA dehydrogenase family protein [Acidimicrobiales bacterium]
MSLVELSPERQQLARVARAYLAPWADGLAASADGPDEAAVVAGAVALGWVGLALPERHGGGGGTLGDVAALYEETGRALCPTALYSAVSGARLVAAAGSPQQRADLLPALCTGEARATIALAEAGNRRPGSLTTTVEEHGERLEVVGEKRFVPDAGGASFLVVVARRPCSANATLVMVDPGAEGVAVGATGTFAGDRQFVVALDRVDVPTGAVLGRLDGGDRPLSAVLDEQAALQAVEMAAGARRALELAVEHVTARVQFGRPLAAFQAVQHHVADTATLIDAARLAAWRAVWLLERGAEATAAVSVAKVAAGRAYRSATLTAFQLCGGAGYVTEHPLHRYADRAKTASLTAGTTGEHLARLSGVLGLGGAS